MNWVVSCTLCGSSYVYESGQGLPDMCPVCYEKGKKEVKKFLEKEFEKLSLGKHIDKVVNKKYIVLEIDSLLCDNLKYFWTNYLDEKMSWEQ